MTAAVFDQTQRTGARAVGYSYLIAMALLLFTGFYVLAQLIVPGDASHTVCNIINHERLFRLSIASDLLAFAVDVVLITSLYLVLKPVNRGLALLAAFFRVIETAIMLVIAFNNFDVLRLLSAADYLSRLNSNSYGLWQDHRSARTAPVTTSA
jgi:Domain of unknown function (DUF4386)